MDNAHEEEHEHQYQGCHNGNHKKTHTQVFLGAQSLLCHLFALAFQFLACQSDSTLYHAPTLHDTDNACHCNSTDTDIAGIVAEYPLRVGFAQHHAVNGSHAQQRNQEPPYEQTAGADDSRIFQSHNIAQAQYCSTRVERESEFPFLCQHLSPTCHACSEALGP